VLSLLSLRIARIKATFYANAAALFINPIREDIFAVQEILNLFGNASGLRTNLDKCVAYSVACEGLDLDSVLEDFGGNQGSFPCSYLGLPLGAKKPKRVEVQPLLDRAHGRLKGGRGKMMSFKGRLVLINSVIIATSTYFLTAFPPTPWLSKQFDKLRRNFPWAPEDKIVSGGKCIVNWKRICAPKLWVDWE
jgi:hypothetical protein